MPEMTPREAYNRALLGATPELDAIIATSARYSYEYAAFVLRFRFEPGETAIATDAEYSYRYARHVLRNRFELGEAAIATSARYAYYYAVNVLKGRFVLGELVLVIGGYSEYWDEYVRRFLVPEEV